MKVEWSAELRTFAAAVYCDCVCQRLVGVLT